MKLIVICLICLNILDTWEKITIIKNLLKGYKETYYWEASNKLCLCKYIEVIL